MPLGTCPLGPEEPSTTFRTFIPVGSLTAAQRRAVTTGGTIGIHGLLQIPPGTDLVRPTGDWTLGCIALPTESAIDEVARWLHAEGVARIIIERAHYPAVTGTVVRRVGGDRQAARDCRLSCGARFKAVSSAAETCHGTPRFPHDDFQ